MKSGAAIVCAEHGFERIELLTAGNGSGCSAPKDEGSDNSSLTKPGAIKKHGTQADSSCNEDRESVEIGIFKGITEWSDDIQGFTWFFSREDICGASPDLDDDRDALPAGIAAGESKGTAQ